MARPEPSRRRRRESIRFGTGAPGLERAEVYLAACAFEPHRHDTYAIGVTTAGVQRFRYRGADRVCLPGQLHVEVAQLGYSISVVAGGGPTISRPYLR